MSKTILYWGLASFVFYKVAFEIAFDNWGLGISVIAAALLSGMVAISVHYASYWYMMVYTKEAFKARVLKQEISLWDKIFGIFIVTATLNFVLGRLIIFGFSKTLNQHLGGVLWFEYYTDNHIVITVVCLLIAPIILNFGFSAYSIHTMTQNFIIQNKYDKVSS